MTTASSDSPPPAPIVLRCADLEAALACFTGALGFRLDLILPADAPTTAVVSGQGQVIRLEAGPADRPEDLIAADGLLRIPDGTQEFSVSRLPGADAWRAGRAGMLYRDLIPGRLGGRFIASHIRIPAGGPVPDYVHFHQVRFQLIFCRTGWVRVVYEDQGPPFVLEAGDCVLQPPGIRHRVLEASAGLEVIEVGCPAVHTTCVDHDLALPTASARPERRFGGQRFVRHRAAQAHWSPWHGAGCEACDTGIAAATDGLAAVRLLRCLAPPEPGSGDAAPVHVGEFLFLFVLRGELVLRGPALGDHRLLAGDCCALPQGAHCSLEPGTGMELLEVKLPAEAGTA